MGKCLSRSASTWPCSLIPLRTNSVHIAVTVSNSRPWLRQMLPARLEHGSKFPSIHPYYGERTLSEATEPLFGSYTTQRTNIVLECMHAAKICFSSTILTNSGIQDRNSSHTTDEISQIRAIQRRISLTIFGLGLGFAGKSCCSSLKRLACK